MYSHYKVILLLLYHVVKVDRINKKKKKENLQKFVRIRNKKE